MASIFVKEGKLCLSFPDQSDITIGDEFTEEVKSELADKFSKTASFRVEDGTHHEFLEQIYLIAAENIVFDKDMIQLLIKGIKYLVNVRFEIKDRAEFLELFNVGFLQHMMASLDFLREGDFTDHQALMFETIFISSLKYFNAKIVKDKFKQYNVSIPDKKIIDYPILVSHKDTHGLFSKIFGFKE